MVSNIAEMKYARSIYGNYNTVINQAQIYDAKWQECVRSHLIKMSMGLCTFLKKLFCNKIVLRNAGDEIRCGSQQRNCRHFLSSITEAHGICSDSTSKGTIQEKTAWYCLTR